MSSRQVRTRDPTTSVAWGRSSGSVVASLPDVSIVGNGRAGGVGSAGGPGRRGAGGVGECAASAAAGESVLHGGIKSAVHVGLRLVPTEVKAFVRRFIQGDVVSEWTNQNMTPPNEGNEARRFWTMGMTVEAGT